MVGEIFSIPVTEDEKWLMWAWSVPLGTLLTH